MMAGGSTQSDARGGRTRGPRRGSTPTFSVVIVACGEEDQLEVCLRRLEGPCIEMEAEMIVVHRRDDSHIARLVRAHPSARFVAGPADVGTAELRGIGMTECGGDIVAITRDCDDRGPEWLEIMMRRSRVDAAYGPRTSPDVDWAAVLRSHGIGARNGNGDGVQA